MMPLINFIKTNYLNKFNKNLSYLILYLLMLNLQKILKKMKILKEIIVSAIINKKNNLYVNAAAVKTQKF